MAGGDPSGDLRAPAPLPPVVAPPDTGLSRARTSLTFRARDLGERLTGRRDRLTPPRRMYQYVGHGDFAAVGDEFLALMRAHAALTETDRVLDVGCGIGRMARALAHVLRTPGSYEGFDVASSGIDWCSRHYRRLPAPFRFTHVDLANATYNPSGKETAATFRFPYADDAFDLVIATSVFTHLLPDETSNYMSEIGRVLAPGGRLFSTWFLVDPDRPAPAPFERQLSYGPALVADEQAPTAAVAYPLDFIHRSAHGTGVSIGPVHWGNWSAPGGTSVQDIVVGEVQR